MNESSRREGNRKAPQRLILMIAALAVMLGGWASAAPSADAATASCGDGRCIVRLSKAETVALGQGRVPAVPAATPWQLRASYFALAQGHRLIARQYANRGWCSAFLLSVRPWENQGYTGYRC
ncbi:hypothetical protein [Gordonia amicalis]|uniref:hypothetical protein n=1 Tax=Gordonia amicalis TaxID=89053 RepID=UPI003A7FDBEF